MLKYKSYSQQLYYYCKKKKKKIFHFLIYNYISQKLNAFHITKRIENHIEQAKLFIK